MNSRYDAIIIGAGVIGAAVAFELSKKGYRTLNVDKLPAAGYGSTSNSCAIVRTHYSTWDGTALAYESFLGWQRWPAYLEVEDERGPARLIETGMLIVKSRAQDFQRHLALHDALGIPYEEWDVETLRSRFPFYDLTAFHPPRRADDERFGEASGGAVPGAIFIPTAGYVNDPQLSAHNLQRAAEARGATFLFNAEVTGIFQHGGRVTGVGLSDGSTLEAPVVVNVGGPHSALINRMAGVEDRMRLRTRALRHEVHYLPRPESAGIADTSPFMSDDDIGGYSRPEVGGLLLVGSLDPACDAPEWVDDPDRFDRDVTEEVWQNQVFRMALRIPDLPIPSRPKGIADLYDVTDDWMPIYDRSDLNGFYLAIGTSGNQFKNAPMAGRIMAELITAVEDGRDHDTDPVQVVGPHTGLTFDIGFYSRNRAIHQDSSFSVLG